PILLISSVAVILIMSTLYHSLSEILEVLTESERNAKHAALHDVLTGLGNRTLLADRIEQSLRHMKRDGGAGALLMLDLDGFKQVNDAFGHNVGDQLIKEIARRLLWRLRDVDTVARIGGDEFAIWLSNVPHLSGIKTVCQAILEDVSEVCSLADQEIYVGVSIGAVQATGTDLVSDLLRKADIAMYDAKADGRGCFKIFTKGMDAEVQRRTIIEKKMRQALENKDCQALQVHFQPLMNRGQEIVGVEGLLRWTDPELGPISPAESIPIAEDCGLIGKLTALVVDQACITAVHFPDLQISINLSASQFHDENLALRLEKQVRGNGIRCSQIELEITESLLLEHSQICGRTLGQLRGAGFGIALDDFGTGYSSLSYLHEFQVDTVKLDRSFIQSAKYGKSIAILSATIALGHAINLRVVAEGIENLEQQNIALDAGCDVFQGNFFAPPMAPVELVDFILTSKKGQASAA
ncbi:EAL domain-containing protein, partial [Parasphingorhabdus sp.]